MQTVWHCAEISVLHFGELLESGTPEQIKSEELDSRADLYSLGVTLYEMVTGRCPYTGNSEFAVMQAHLQQLPQAPIDIVPGVPAAVNAAILVAMAKTREARFQSAEAMRAALSGQHALPANG